MWYHRPRDVVCSLEIRVDEFIEVCVRRVGQGEGCGIHTSAVEDIVNAVELFDGVVDVSLALFGIRNGKGFGVVLATAEIVGFFETGFVDVLKGEDGALGGDFESCGTADARRRPCD